VNRKKRRADPRDFVPELIAKGSMLLRSLLMVDAGYNRDSASTVFDIHHLYHISDIPQLGELHKPDKYCLSL